MLLASPVMKKEAFSIHWICKTTAKPTPDIVIGGWKILGFRDSISSHLHKTTYCAQLLHRERKRLLGFGPFTKGTDHYKLDAFEEVKFCGVRYSLWSSLSTKFVISRRIDSEGEGKHIQIWAGIATEVWLANKRFTFHARATTLANVTCKHEPNHITFGLHWTARFTTNLRRNKVVYIMNTWPFLWTTNK